MRVVPREWVSAEHIFSSANTKSKLTCSKRRISKPSERKEEQRDLQMPSSQKLQGFPHLSSFNLARSDVLGIRLCQVERPLGNIPDTFLSITPTTKPTRQTSHLDSCGGRNGHRIAANKLADEAWRGSRMFVTIGCSSKVSSPRRTRPTTRFAVMRRDIRTRGVSGPRQTQHEQSVRPT